MEFKPEHHDLDIHPIPKEKAPLFINEPWLIDGTLLELGIRRELLKALENQPDNIRIYLPLDINREAILRRLEEIICRYGAATEANESSFCHDVRQVIAQFEIYDQRWPTRGMEEGRHSQKAIRLVQEIIARLQAIPDGCAERFPFELIEELENAYL